MDDNELTRKSLLLRLKQGSGNRDWEAFYRQYSGVILRFCRYRGLDEWSARDVLQETMVLVIRKLPDFEYDPSRGRFRSWLLTLVAGKMRDAFRRASRAPTVSLDDSTSLLNPSRSLEFAANGDDGSQALEKAWMQSLVEEALERIQEDSRTKPESLAVFRALTVDGKPVAEVAKAFHLQPNAVYQIKDRLMKRLREEVTTLQAPLLPKPEQKGPKHV